MANDDRTPWLEALFGRIWNDGELLELQGGLNFRGGLRAEPDLEEQRIDILVDALSSTSDAISNESSVPGATVTEALDALYALVGGVVSPPAVQYVDGSIGDDANDGLTELTPVATIDKAMQRFGDRITQDSRIIILGPSSLPGGYSVAELARERQFDARLAILGESWSTTVSGIPVATYVDAEASITVDPSYITNDDDYVGQYIEITASSTASLVGKRRLISRTDASTGQIWYTYGFSAAVPAGTTFSIRRPSVILDLDTGVTGASKRASFRAPSAGGADVSFEQQLGMTWVHVEMRTSTSVEVEFWGCHNIFGVHVNSVGRNVTVAGGAGRIGRLFGSAAFLGVATEDIAGHGLVVGTISGATWTPGTDGDYYGYVSFERAQYGWLNVIAGQVHVSLGSFVLLRGCRIKGWDFPATSGSLFGKGEARVWAGQLFALGSFAAIPFIDGGKGETQVVFEYSSQLDILGRVDSPKDNGRWLFRYGGTTLNLREPLTISGNLEVLGGAKLRMQGDRRGGIGGSLLVGYNDNTDHTDFSFIGSAVLASDGSAAIRTA